MIIQARQGTYLKLGKAYTDSVQIHVKKWIDPDKGYRHVCSLTPKGAKRLAGALLKAVEDD